ncbi:MAG: FecR family protein, partial [Butyricimonas paravirosa]
MVKITPGAEGGIDHGRSNRSRVKWRAGAARDRSEKGVVIKQGGANLEYDSLVASVQEVALAMNTLRVPRGGEFRLKLSDGTNVYLNSASELKYPVRFDEKERRVYLSGEAYFEVTKDSNRPFYVITEEVQVRVYGTEFNVNTHQPGKVHT